MPIKEPLPPSIQASLKVINGAAKGEVFQLHYTRNVIGRKAGDIIFKDSKISQKHATIEYVKGSFYLVDLNSTNGSYVNHQKVDEARIENGNEIKLGLTAMVFILNVDSPKLKTNPQALEKTERIEDAVPNEESQIELISEAPMEPSSPTVKQPSQIPFRVVLKIIQGKDLHRSFEFTQGSILIGRMNSDVVLNDRDISRKHAVIEIFGKDRIYIRDLMSTNGTLVNQRRISNCKLKSNDEIVIGKTKLQFIIK